MGKLTTEFQYNSLSQNFMMKLNFSKSIVKIYFLFILQMFWSHLVEPNCTQNRHFKPTSQPPWNRKYFSSRKTTFNFINRSAVVLCITLALLARMVNVSVYLFLSAANGQADLVITWVVFFFLFLGRFVWPVSLSSVSFINEMIFSLFKLQRLCHVEKI